jgi:hypothetical protein
VGGQLPENDYVKKSKKNNISECVLHIHGENGVCAPPSIVKKIREYVVRSSGYNAASVEKMTDDAVMEAAKTLLGVENESEVLDHKDIKGYVGNAAIHQTLQTFFKAIGPTDSTALLDNFNIDETLEKWSIHSEKLFKGNKFYHIPFQMIDFEKTGTELSKLDIQALMSKGYKSFGVVLNTDVSTGGGKHWFCLYGDLDHAGTEKDPIVIEYFNSSGNSPMDSVANWLEGTEHELRKSGVEARIHRSVPRRLQESQTECGVWSLMYILSRLKGRPAEWFYNTKANDMDMIDVRKYLFRAQ